jgi:hypothetical protein
VAMQMVASTAAMGRSKEARKNRGRVMPICVSLILKVSLLNNRAW